MPLFVASHTPQLVVALHTLVLRQGLMLTAIADGAYIANLLTNRMMRGILFIDIASCQPYMSGILNTWDMTPATRQDVALVLIGDRRLIAPSDLSLVTRYRLPHLPFPFAEADYLQLLQQLLPQYP